eukprot:SAG31_NODE_18343_length_639_cov_8.540741_1_plen_90_part_10
MYTAVSWPSKVIQRQKGNPAVGLADNCVNPVLVDADVACWLPEDADVRRSESQLGRVGTVATTLLPMVATQVLSANGSGGFRWPCGWCRR